MKMIFMIEFLLLCALGIVIFNIQFLVSKINAHLKNIFIKKEFSGACVCADCEFVRGEIFKAKNKTSVRCNNKSCDNFICKNCNKHIFKNLQNWASCNPKLDFCNCCELRKMFCVLSRVKSKKSDDSLGI